MRDLVADPAHAGDLGAAAALGEASDGARRIVRIGLFPDGPALRARWKASSCASLMACAEVACALLEAGAAPADLDAARLCAHLSGLPPDHRDRAALVAEALRRALAQLEPGAAP